MKDGEEPRKCTEPAGADSLGSQGWARLGVDTVSILAQRAGHCFSSVNSENPAPFFSRSKQRHLFKGAIY